MFPNDRYPQTLQDRVEDLREAREYLLRALNRSGALKPEKARAPSSWTAAEVAYHLHLTERSIFKLLRKLLGQGARGGKADEESLLKEWERIRKLIGNRKYTASAPSIVVPAGAPDVPESLRLLGESRAEVQSLLAKATLDDLISISAPHPFPAVGTLTGAGWLSAIAYHEFRHAEQIREITA